MNQPVADWTLWAADYMLDDSPDYYFATCNWAARPTGPRYDERGGVKDAWYHDRQGDQSPWSSLR